MKISQALASTLIVAITDAIQKGGINRYGSISFPNEWDIKTLEAVGEDFAKTLAKSLDGVSLSQFVSDKLQFIRVGAGEALPAKDASLAKLKCFNDPLETARNIVSLLEAVPTQYRIMVRVCHELGERADRDDLEIKLSDRLRLLSGKKIPNTFQLEHKNKALNDFIRGAALAQDSTFKPEDSALYLEHRTSGYIFGRRSSRAVAEFFDECRAFYGACIAYKLFVPYNIFDSNEITPVLIANSIGADGETFAHVDRVEEDIVRCTNVSTATATDQRINNGVSLEDILSPIMPVFQSRNTNKLKTACSWSLRGHLSSRSLDKVLESTIAMEVLLGDRDTSDRIGLSKLMANRCAYALGRSTNERDDIVEFFVKFYRLRSEIVHSGRTNLDAEERKIVTKGVELATRILKHEIEIAS